MLPRCSRRNHFSLQCKKFFASPICAWVFAENLRIFHGVVDKITDRAWKLICSAKKQPFGKKLSMNCR
jgi:hypothetical protein